MKKFQHVWTSAAAFGLAASVQAGFFAGSTDFEGQSPLSDGLWSAVGDAEIQTDASVSTAASRPANYDFAANRDKVLVIDNDEPILRSLQSGGAAASVGDGIYADVLVKGTALANGADAPEPSAGDKLLVYFRVNQAGTATNLCVLATDSNGATNEVAFTNTSVGKDEWHRVVIAAKAGNAYQFYFDGDTLCTAGATDTVYALTPGDTVSSIGFKGTGSVDDLVLSTYVPSLPLTTLTWDTSLASVSYTVNGAAGDALTPTDGSYVCQIPTGATVVMTGNNGYRSFSTTGTTLETPTGIAKYTDQITGSGTEQDPYLIPNFAALVGMKDAVADAAAFRSAYYKQTANIDCTGEAPFAGIGTYGDAALTHASAIPFTGNYDGQGYKISNITFTDRDYAGVFNRVDGGTIKNLTVENVGYVGTGSKYCASIVGYALNGATLENLVSTGTFGLQEKPGTHNMAGIVVRVSGGTTGDGTQILNCTNNATIYGGYTKLAGICAISQEKIAAAENPKMVFSGCANNGELVLNRSSDGITGLAGIVGYSDVNTVMTDCSNTGTITQQGTGYNTDCTGTLIGMTYGHSITDGGNNSAQSNKKMIGKWAGATETGFLYATVENGIATTIAPPYTLAKDTTYLLEGNATPSFELAAAGDTIAFDEALTYTLTGSGITAATGLTVSSNKVGSVTTFSAAVAQYTITWTDHGGTVKTETLDYGATPTAPATTPVQYVENGTIYNGTWPTPAAVTGDAIYAATYTGTDAKATVITITGATTNVVGTYATLAEAVRAANDGDTVVLLADETADATKTTQADRLVVTNQITIDFGEYTYSVPGSLEPTANWCAIFIDADTVVKGTTGGINCLDEEDPSDPCGVYAFNVRNNAKLTIEGGVYHGGGTVVQAQLGTVEINGGTFSVTPFDAPYGYDYALNCVDPNYQAGNAGFEINGGTFVGFDPQDNGSEGAGTDYTADDYVAIDDGNGNFVVQPGYNVTFDANGGSPVPEAQRVAAGGKANAPATAPVKAGYTFNGWTLDGAAFDFDTVLVDDITLVAAFDSAVATVMTIADAGATTNYTDYATLAAAVDAAQTGDTVVLLANVNEAIVNTANKNFTIDLNGRTWSSDSDVLATSAGTITIEATNGGTMATEAAQCCAVWAKGGNVVINGGTFTSKDNEEATIYVSNANSVVTINGGTFENTDPRPYRWKTSLHALTLNVQNDLVGQHLVINGGTFIGNDPQLGDDTAGGTYAQSSVKFVSDNYVAIDDGTGVFVVQPGYNVTFDANGGSPVPEAQRVAAGGMATEPAEPTKEGYTFDGWFADGASVPFDFDTVLDDDIELVAAWSEAQHETPHVDVGGGLAAWNAEHPGNAVDPVKIDGEGFKASFIAPAEGYYYLMTASTPASSDEAYTADLGTEYYVGASDVGKPVTLVDDDMSATSKFYKIGYSAEAIDAGN